MDDQKYLCVLIVLFLIGESLPALTPKVHVCDESRSDDLQEGNIGQSESFPWLGILRVHLHEFDQLKIAVTGLVLVKDRYAIANAEDISKIPKQVFMQDSKAMFIPKKGEPWFAKPKDYMIHPEFEFSTYNTIALVELELEENTILPFKAVCWPGSIYNTSNYLYALGYTDDNKLLEKTLYSLEYVKPSLCEEFYNRAGFTEPKSAPKYIQCGFAANNKKDCLWENGMALASNSTGIWTLIGFGVRGPGCSAPARFIDMSAYLPWVETATDLEQIDDYPNFRRFDQGVEWLDRDSNLTREPIAINEYYPYTKGEQGTEFKIYRMEPGLTKWFEMPLHIEQAGFMNSGGCWAANVLVYRERMRLAENSMNGGNLEYRVSVYDKNLHNYTCIKLKIRNVVSQRPVLVYFTYHIDNLEGTGFTNDYADTASKILKYFPFPKRQPKEEVHDPYNPPKWKPGSHLEPRYIVDEALHSGHETINIIIGFTFKGTATMNLYVYGYPLRYRRTTTTRPVTPPFWKRPGPTYINLTHIGKRRKRKSRLEKARERTAERKVRRRPMIAFG